MPVSDESTPLAAPYVEPVMPEMTRGQALSMMALSVRDREVAEAARVVADTGRLECRASVWTAVADVLRGKGGVPILSTGTLGLVLAGLHLVGIGVDLDAIADAVAHWRTGEPHLVECAQAIHPLLGPAEGPVDGPL